MATNEGFLASWSGGSAYARTDVYEAGRNDAAGYVDVNWWVGVRDTHVSVSGTWDWHRYGQSGDASGSVGAAPGTRGIQSGTTRWYCDANGNYANFGVGMHMDVYFGQGDSVTTIGFGRSPLAPGIAAITADSIKPSSARVGVEITGHGHGTSSAMRVWYRLQGSGSGWTNAGDQGDVGGYNYWTISGLKPGKTYEYYSEHWNNMGDTSTSGIQTFKTKNVPGMTPVLMGIVG